jgi:hypothetical protein
MMNYFSKSREIILLVALIVFLIALFTGMLPEGSKKNSPTNIITEQHEGKRTNQGVRPGKRGIGFKNFSTALKIGDMKTQRGYFLVILGFLIGWFGWLWLVVKGFKKSITWGIVIISFSFFGALFFARNYWDEAKIPLLLSSIGGFMFYVGMQSIII